MQKRFDRHSQAGIEEVLEQVQLRLDGKTFHRAFINEQSVGVQSTRLKTFCVHGIVCSSCGIKGQFFALERNLADVPRNGRYHINLYALDDQGNEVLMTHDHTLARALGGADHDLKNTSTMCSPCNNRKSKKEAKKVVALRKILLAADVGPEANVVHAHPSTHLDDLPSCTELPSPPQTLA
jgi:hypothetical protein